MTALSPDGRYLAVNAGRDPDTHIYLRPLQDVAMKLVAGTKHGYNPFFSPDGKWIAFTAEQKLRRVPVAGGQTHVICDADWGGGTWGANDVIVFTPNYASGLWKVNATGGKPEKLTDANPGAGELGHWWPQFLPDGRHVVFTSFSTPIDKSRVMLYSLDTGAQRVLVEGAMFGRVLNSGHIVYARANGIVGAPFDLRRRELTDAEAPVLDAVSTHLSNGVAQMSVATNGTLAFIPSNEASTNTELVWVDRAGAITQALPPRRRHQQLRLSPDGRRIALTIENENRDVWTYDFERGVLGRVTSGAASEFGARWTPDGRRIAFASETPVFRIFIKQPSGTAAEEPLVTENYDAEPMAISPDGQLLVYTISPPATRSDVWIRPLSAGSKGKPLIATKSDERSADISPDGRWIVYTSDESGRPEVYVQGFPEATDRWQVTTDGAVEPRWSETGRELYYAAGQPERLVSVPISLKAGGIVVGKPATAYEGRFHDYDVAPDGRILVLRSDPKAPPPSIHVVLNWFEELRAKLSK
jgi:serine/threonine-protein kinase